MIEVEELDQKGLQPDLEQRAPRVKRQDAGEDDVFDGDGQLEAGDALRRGTGTIKTEASKGSGIVNNIVRYAFGDKKEKALRNAYLKLKKFSKEIGKEAGVALGFRKRESPWSIWATSTIMSSIYDRSEQYQYSPDIFPFKRAVKLVVKDGELQVALTNDLDIYGVCVDVDDTCYVATVVPLGHSYQGYLVCNYNTNLKEGDILDFSTIGEVTKSVAPNLPTLINMRALSNSFKLDFRNSLERKDEDFKKAVDYSVALVKVILYGNRLEAKKN